MNDPHVDALIYTVEHGDSVDYTSAEPLAHIGALFRLRVDGLRVRFEMLEHFATEGDARAVVDPFIRQWEFDTTLNRGPDTFTLLFHHAEVVDRRPPPGSRGDLGLRIVARAGVPTARVNLRAVTPYPSPPATGVALTPDVVTMWHRYLGYRRGAEPLPSMAYFCYRLLRSPTDEPSISLPDVARKYRVSKPVLVTIRRLSSERGGALARRPEGIGKELTSSEVRFLEDALRTLIRRAAEVAHDPDVDRHPICMSDLPSIRD